MGWKSGKGRNNTLPWYSFALNNHQGQLTELVVLGLTIRLQREDATTDRLCQLDVALPAIDHNHRNTRVFHRLKFENACP